MTTLEKIDAFIDADRNWYTGMELTDELTRLGIKLRHLTDADLGKLIEKHPSRKRIKTESMEGALTTKTILTEEGEQFKKALENALSKLEIVFFEWKGETFFIEARPYILKGENEDTIIHHGNLGVLIGSLRMKVRKNNEAPTFQPEEQADCHHRVLQRWVSTNHICRDGLPPN